MAETRTYRWVTSISSLLRFLESRSMTKGILKGYAQGKDATAQSGRKHHLDSTVILFRQDMQIAREGDPGEQVGEEQVHGRR